MKVLFLANDHHDTRLFLDDLSAALAAHGIASDRILGWHRGLRRFFPSFFMRSWVSRIRPDVIHSLIPNAAGLQKSTDLPWLNEAIEECVALPVGSPSEQIKKIQWAAGIVPGRLTIGFDFSGEESAWVGFLGGCEMRLREGGVFQLLIRATRDQAASLRKLMRTKGLDKHCFWLSEGENITGLWECSDIAVVAGSQNGFLRSALLPMGFGKPVLAPLALACVQNGLTGFVCAPDSPADWREALAFLEDADRRTQMGQAACALVAREYDAQARARHWAGRYLSLQNASKNKPKN